MDTSADRPRFACCLPKTSAVNALFEPGYKYLPDDPSPPSRSECREPHRRSVGAIPCPQALPHPLLVSILNSMPAYICAADGWHPCQAERGCKKREVPRQPPPLLQRESGESTTTTATSARFTIPPGDAGGEQLRRPQLTKDEAESLFVSVVEVWTQLRCAQTLIASTTLQ